MKSSKILIGVLLAKMEISLKATIQTLSDEIKTLKSKESIDCFVRRGANVLSYKSEIVPQLR